MITITIIITTTNPVSPSPPPSSSPSSSPPIPVRPPAASAHVPVSSLSLHSAVTVEPNQAGFVYVIVMMMTITNSGLKHIGHNWSSHHFFGTFQAFAQNPICLTLQFYLGIFFGTAGTKYWILSRNLGGKNQNKIINIKIPSPEILSSICCTFPSNFGNAEKVLKWHARLLWYPAWKENGMIKDTENFFANVTGSELSRDLGKYLNNHLCKVLSRI